MIRVATQIFFALAMMSAIALGSHYVWKRTARDTALPKWGRYTVVALLAVGGLLLPLTFLLSRLPPRDIICPVIFGAFVWLSVLLYVFFIVGAWDVGGLFFRLGIRMKGWLGRKGSGSSGGDGSAGERKGQDPVKPEPKQAENPSRRVFLARAVAGTAVLGAGTITTLGLQLGLGDIETPEVPVRLPRLPRALSGFRIALLADLHLGPTLRRRFTEAVVERTNRLKPDLVAIVGDLVDGPVGFLGEDVAPLRRLRAPHGVFFSTGNHEYYSGVEGWLKFVRRLGIEVLGNRRVSVGDKGPGGVSFDLAGIYDRRGGWFGHGHKPNVGPIVHGRDPDRELVLMAHQPAQVDQAVRAGAGLMLSGHTHGGQFFPWTLMVRLVQPYVSGLHRHTDRTQVYVTRGTGYWGPPVRFLAPAEISLIILTT